MNKMLKVVIPAVLIIAAILAVSWLATCGIVFLICSCFGWTFTWAIGTGVWLALFLLKGLFSVTVKR